MTSNRSSSSKSSSKDNLNSSESSSYKIIGLLGPDTEISKDVKILLSDKQSIEKIIPSVPKIPLNLPFPSNFLPPPCNPIIQQPSNLDTISQPQIFQPPTTPIIKSPLPFIIHSNPPELSSLVNQGNGSDYLKNSSGNITSQDPFQKPDKNAEDPFIKHHLPKNNQDIYSLKIYIKDNHEKGLKNQDNPSIHEEIKEHKISEAVEESLNIEKNEAYKSIIKYSKVDENSQMDPVSINIDNTCNESSGNPLDNSKPSVRIFIYQKIIIKYSRLSRIFIVIHTIISLIYMLPIPVLLPILLVDVYGFVSVMLLNFFMCFSFAILLGLCLAIRFAMTICLGKYIGDYTTNNDHDILSLAFAVFIVLDIMELGFFIFLYKMYTFMNCFDKKRLGEILEIMKNKDYGWKESLMSIKVK